jgi:hypothetical protein
MKVASGVRYHFRNSPNWLSGSSRLEGLLNIARGGSVLTQSSDTTLGAAQGFSTAFHRKIPPPCDEQP